MALDYVEMRNGGYYICGARISLYCVVYLSGDGPPAEAIQDDFPPLSLEQTHGAIAFYLANKKRVDDNISEGEQELNRLAPSLEAAKPELHARLQRARQELKR